MKMSREGIKFLKIAEGFRNKPYKDSAGLLTIGVGHLLTNSELKSGVINIAGTNVSWKNGITDAQIEDLLAQDVVRFEDAVNDLVTVYLTQYQFDALVSFSFNVGVGAFEKSTLLKVLNQKLYENIPAQLARWNKAGGRPVAGLTNRRRAEALLWNGRY